MRRTLSIIFAAAAIAAAASCQQESVEVVLDDSSKVSFTISVPDEETKLAWDRQTGKTSWVTGDKIFMVDTDGKKDLVTVSDQWNGMREAVIESTALGQNANGYYAFYPGNENMSLAASFYGVYHELVPDGTFANSTALAGVANGDKNFNSAIYSGLLMFQISDPEIKSVTFEGLTPNDMFVTGVNYFVSERDNSGRRMRIETSNAVPSITISTEAGPGTYFIGTYPTWLSGLKITASDGTSTAVIELEQEFNITPCRVYDLGEITGRFGFSYKKAETDFTGLVIEQTGQRLDFANGDLSVAFHAYDGEILPYVGQYNELVLNTPSSEGGQFGFGNGITIVANGNYKISAVRVYFGPLETNTYGYRVDRDPMVGPRTASAGAVESWYNLDVGYFYLVCMSNGTPNSPGVSISRVEVSYAEDTRQPAPLTFRDVTGAPVDEVQAVLGEAFTPPYLSGAIGRSIDYYSTDTNVATVDPDTGAVSLVGTGSAAIVARAQGNYYYRPAVASYVINVTEAGVIYGVKNLRDALLSYSERTDFVAQVTDAVITGNNQNSFYLEGDGAGVYVYLNSDSGFRVGESLTGKITGKGYNYSNGIPEITEFNFDGTRGGVPAIIPVTVNLYELNANYSEYVCRRVLIENAQVTAAFGGSDRDGTVLQANDQLAVRTASANYVKTTYPESAVIDICGYPVFYNGAPQLSVNRDEDITFKYRPEVQTVINFTATKQLTVGEQWTPTATASSGAVVSYSSNNPQVAEITAGGSVHALAVGTCEITASVEAVEGFTAAQAVCTLTVSDAQSLFYEKVYSVPTTWTGQYIIVSEYSAGGGIASYALSGKAVTVSGNYGAYADVSGEKMASHAAIRATADIRGYEVEIAATANGYSMKQGDKYLGLNADGNSLYFYTSFSAERDEWTFDLTEGELTITSVKYPARTLQFNSASNSMRFACYKTAQKPVYLYKLNQ